MNTEIGKLLSEAFAELIEKKEWHAGAKSAAMARFDKYKFKRGEKISEDRMREYLLTAGAVKVQDERWQLK